MDARFHSYRFQIYYKNGLNYIKAPIPVFDDHREACAKMNELNRFFTIPYYHVLIAPESFNAN